MYIFSFISILGWIFFLSLKFKKYASYFPLFVVAMIISVLYLGGLIGTLLIFSRLLFYLGLLLPIYSIIILKPTRQDINSLPLGFYFLGIFGLLWFIFTKQATLFGWDEFVWGQFIKVIFNTDHIYTANSAIMSGKLGYPPGISLFQYYFLPFHHYSEAALYFSQGIIVLSAIALIFDLIGRHNPKRLIVFGLAIFSSLVCFGPGLLSMTNDHIIGVFFGSAILASSYILRSNKSKLLLIPVLISLPLVKSTGIVLSSTIVLATALDLLISNFYIIRENKQNKAKTVIPLLIFLILGFFILVPVKSWNYYLKEQDEPASYLPKLSEVKNSFSDKATEREKITIKNFNEAIIRYPINGQEGGINSGHFLFNIYLKIINAINLPGLTIPEWLFILSIPFGFIILFQKKNERLLTLSLCFSLLTGLFIYLLMHLLAYMFWFSEYEGVRLASMSRYISSYFLGLTLVSIGSIAFFMKNNPNRSKLLGSVSGIILLFLLILHTPPLTQLIIPPKLMAEGTNIVREKTIPFSDYINNNTEEGSKVWVIYQNTNGWECIMIRYDIVPRLMNGGSGNWSLGNKYGTKDVWTHDISKEEWSSQLIDQKYDYVFLAQTDDNFWDHYIGIFEDPVTAKSKQLFRVQIKNNQVLLTAK